MARVGFYVKSGPLSVDSTKEADFKNADMPYIYAYVQSDRRWNGRDTIVQDPDIETPPGSGNFVTPPPRTVRVNHTDAEALAAYSLWAAEKLLRDADVHNKDTIRAVKEAEAKVAGDTQTIVITAA